MPPAILQRRTSRVSARSALLPASDMIMPGLPCRSSSFTHSRAFAKLSLLLMSNTITAAAAPLHRVASAHCRPRDGPTDATDLIAYAHLQHCDICSLAICTTLLTCNTSALSCGTSPARLYPCTSTQHFEMQAG